LEISSSWGFRCILVTLKGVFEGAKTEFVKYSTISVGVIVQTISEKIRSNILNSFV